MNGEQLVKQESISRGQNSLPSSQGIATPFLLFILVVFTIGHTFVQLFNTRWEVRRLEGKCNDEILNKWGARGWELVSFDSTGAVVKRPITFLESPESKNPYTVSPSCPGNSEPLNVNLIGLNFQKVVESMGFPIHIIPLKSKTIYVYKNIKVIFTDGQVTDVQ